MTKHTPQEIKNQIVDDFLKSGLSEYQFAKNLPISRHSLRNWVVDYKKQEEIRKTNPHKINVPYTGRILEIDQEVKKTKKLFWLLDTNNLDEKEYKELSEKYKDYSPESPIKTVLSCYDPNWKAENLIASWYENNIMTKYRIIDLLNILKVGSSTTLYSFLRANPELFDFDTKELKISKNKFKNEYKKYVKKEEKWHTKAGKVADHDKMLELVHKMLELVPEYQEFIKNNK